MRFYIDSKSYHMREENQGSFLLMVKRTNQTMMLNPSTMKLFEETDTWRDLSEFIASLGVKSVPAQRLWDDYAGVLYRLHVHGVSKLADWPESRESAVRGGCLADYHDLSAFCRKYKGAPFSVAEHMDNGYYSESNIYEILSRRDVALIFVRQQGSIEACMLLRLSKRSFGGAVMNLETVIYREGLTEAACKAHLRDMLSVAEKSFRNKVLKLRYEVIHHRQEQLAGWLLEHNFYQSAVLPEELSTGQTLTLYDFDLPREGKLQM